MAFDDPTPSLTYILRMRAEKLVKIKAMAPADLAAIKEYYKDHPVDFINDWGMTFDPRNPEVGLPTSVPFSLFPRQAEFVEWVYDRWNARERGLAEKSRDMGISWCCVAVAVHMWLFHPETVIGFGSRKQEYVDNSGDPKSLFWKARYFISKLPREFRPNSWEERKHAPSMRITNPENGAVIVGESGDNIGRGARASIYFVDEAAFIEQDDLVEAALSQSTNCQIDVSTPNGSGNQFYRKAHAGKIKKFTFHWRQDPRKDEAWYAKQVADLDPVILAQEVEIDYGASVANNFISGADVEESFAADPSKLQPIGMKILGVDVSHFGDDESVFTLRQGRVVFPQMVVTGKVDGPDLAQRVLAYADGMGGVDQIVIELDGPGVSCFDSLRRTKYREKVVGVHTGARRNDSKHYNLRSLMWARLREWLREHPNAIPRCGILKAELTALQYSYRDGLLLMEKKTEFKKRVHRSPDRGDSLALTFAANDAPPPPPKPTAHRERYARAGGWLI